jgi:uncharacterized protein
MSEPESSLGRPVWHDLMTTDVDKAIAFYKDLFGWTIKEVDMGGGPYRMIHAAGADHGGISPLQEGDGPVSHWLAHVTVDDADAAAARSTAHGGTTIVPPSDIPNVGRFTVIADPTGGVISAFKPNPGQGGEEPTERPAPGTFCWDELLALDPEAAGQFYSAVFGWQVAPQDMGAMTYYLWKRTNGKDAGGMLKKPDGAPPSAWIPYVAVENANERTERVRQLGGQVYVPPTDIPNVGRFSVFADPTGATIALLGPST